MAFVIAAVSLIIGILVFSEITESMAETIPEILVTIPTTPEVEGMWFAREHCVNINCTNFPSPEYRFSFTPDTTNGFDGVVKMTTTSGTSPVATGGHLGKVFDKADLDGKAITWEYSRDRLNGAMPRLSLYDGVIDPNKFANAPLSCGTDCFQDEGGVIVSASGGSIQVIQAVAGFSDFTVKNSTGSANLSSFDSPTGKVTLTIFQPENSPAVGIGSNTFQVTIQDLGTYRFKSDPANSWSGSSIICHDHCGSSPKEETLWSVTSLPPPAIPVVNSIDTLNANAAFDRTINIGWTVISIIPITLFFALFTLFSPRIDGEIF